MKTTMLTLLLVCVTALNVSAMGTVQKSGTLENEGDNQPVLTKLDVATQMKKVNDYYMARHQSPGNSWVTSAYFVGCMKFYNLYPEQRVLDYMNAWAEKHKWSLGTNADKHGADGQVCGQTYIDLYVLDGKQDDNKINAIKSCMDDLVAHPSESMDDWWWADSYFMAMPIFAKLGALYDDDAYFKQMHDMQEYSMKRWKLYSETDHFWYRDSTQVFGKAESPNGKPVYWSRANGWAIAAFALAMDYLPDDSPYRVKYVQLMQEMAESLRNVQRGDGFWNRNLGDDQHLPGPETSGTALFAYGIAWGINHGILDGATYRPVVEKAWNGLVDIAVREDGLLGYVQGPGFKPESNYPLDENTSYDYGVGAFLLAGSEVIEIAEGDMPELGDLPDRFDEEEINMEVTASASENSSRTPDKTLDRDFSTRWSAEGEQWIKYDLLESKIVSAVELAFWDGHKRKFYFSIELSEDDENWQEVFDGESSGTVDNDWEKFSFAPSKARYVKINGRGNSSNRWNSILETRIHAEKIPPLGNAENPYLVTDASELNEIRNHPDAHYRLMNDIDLEDWLAENSPEEGWEPINGFTGSLDGNGFSVSGFWINRPSTDKVGLFGSISGGTIKRLGLLMADGKGVVGNNNVGAFVGHTPYSTSAITIEECFVSGGTVEAKGSAAGGILGYTSTNSVAFNIVNCYVSGTTVIGADGAGGIVGTAYRSIDVENCYSTGIVKSANNDKSAGGIVGGTNALSDSYVIQNCIALNSEIQSAKSAGRIVGWMKSEEKAKLSNNYAFAGMLVDGATLSGTATDNNGLDKAKEEVNEQATYESLGWAFGGEGIWVMGNGEYALPVLKNVSMGKQPIVMPEHLDVKDSSMNTLESSLLVYPTVTDNRIFICNKPLHSKVFVYSLSGCLVMQSEVSVLNLSSLPEGVYLIKVNDEIVKIQKQ